MEDFCANNCQPVSWTTSSSESATTRCTLLPAAPESAPVTVAALVPNKQSRTLCRLRVLNLIFLLFCNTMEIYSAAVRSCLEDGILGTQGTNKLKRDIGFWHLNQQKKISDLCLFYELHIARSFWSSKRKQIVYSIRGSFGLLTVYHANEAFGCEFLTYLVCCPCVTSFSVPSASTLKIFIDENATLPPTLSAVETISTMSPKRAVLT